ncbi:Prolactin regulatory element-binding protein [Halotydeus destructor]|nr:Prolactin regulatory element-binding protein [Halotydeus destructor]
MDIFLAEPSSGPRVNCSYAANGTSSGLLGQVSGAKSVPANILKDHENSATNAILYIGIVLAVYVLAVCFIGFRYFLTKSQRKLLFTPYYFTRTKFLLLATALALVAGMANKPHVNSSLLARVNFPLYTIKVLSERHFLVGGGGGAAKTGITNSFEIYELVNDSDRQTCNANRIVHYDTGSRAIMNSTIFAYDDQLFLAAGGPDGICQLYTMKLSVKREGDHKLNGPRSRAPSSPANGGDFRPRTDSETLRRRRNSSTSSNKENRDDSLNSMRQRGGSIVNNGVNGTKEKTNGHIPNGHSHEKSNDDVPPNISFDLQPVKLIQTDFNTKPNDEPFQKVARFCGINGTLVTGGADGHIRFWRFPDLEKLADIEAHTDEVDDLDIEQLGNRAVSISRDGHGYVWDMNTKSKLFELQYSLPVQQKSTKPIKYIFRGCRFGLVEGDQSNTKLFTIINPLVRQKPPNPAYICKWNTSSYKIEKLIDAGQELLSTMSISDDGKYLGIGTQEGTVNIYIAFSLQRLYQFPSAHKQFVTGVQFLHTCDETQKLCGGFDASLLSVSVDNHIMVHHVPKQSILGFLGSSILFVATLLLVYFLMDFFGL